MIPVLLIGRSFLRQNRWLLLTLAAWPFATAAFLRFPNGSVSHADVQEALPQQVLYGVAVITFLASSALHNERRSRRIIAVLSKAVSRTEYLLGMLLGAGCCAAAYFAAVGGSLLWMLGYSRAVFTALPVLFVCGCLACLWMAALALLLSTFLYPFFAAAIAAGVAAIPVLSPLTRSIFVPAALIEDAVSFSSQINWTIVMIALLEAAVMVGLASSIFARGDVTVSVE